MFQLTIILIILFFSISILIANADNGHIIKAIYFVPKNRVFKGHIPQKLSDQIKRTQKFYADQMEFHGYGRMTFEFEKDVKNNPVVHQVIGKFDDSYYHNNTIHKVETEIRQKFHDVDRNIYIISVDISTGLIGAIVVKQDTMAGPFLFPLQEIV